MLLETKSDLLNIWIETGWYPLITITIGEERLSFSSLGFPDKKFSELTTIEKEELSNKLEKILLETK